MTIISAAALAAAGIAALPRGDGAVAAVPPRPLLDALGPQSYSPLAAREAATVRAADIPLPAGGNFNGIRWEGIQGEIAVGTIEILLQHNASCQWLRAWRRGSGTALDMFRRTASWSELRSSPIGEVAAEATRGGGPNLRTMLAQCGAAHTREVAYAKQLGLAPST